MHAYTKYLNVHMKLPSGLVAATAVPGGRGWRTATLDWKGNSEISQTTSKNAIHVVPLVFVSRQLFRVGGVDSPDHHLPSVMRSLSTGRMRGMNLQAVRIYL